MENTKTKVHFTVAMIGRVAIILSRVDQYANPERNFVFTFKYLDLHLRVIQCKGNNRFGILNVWSNLQL